MFITLARDEAHRRLEAAGYRYLETLNFSCEVWLHSDGAAVYLHPELDGTGAYEEEALKSAEQLAR